jgi:nitrite reductase (NADH) small subunit
MRRRFMTSKEHDLGAAEQFAEGRPYRIELGPRAIVLVRKGEEFYALRDICPHKGAALSAGCVRGTPLACQPWAEVPYGRDGEIIVCPWHGWEFDLKTGRTLAATETARVRSFPVTVREGRVVLNEGTS